MRIPALESLFPEPWPAAARRVLPSQSPQLMATAMWGPVLAWSTLALLAESVDASHPEQAALDLFDRLRLREPLAHAFEALGFEAEESWRVAARIKVALLISANVFAPAAPPAEAVSQEAASPVESVALPILSPALWQDPDVRWLTGAHDAEGRSYFVKESYEELLWWLQIPALCKLAAEPSPARSKIQEINKNVREAVKLAASAGYRIDALFEHNSEGVFESDKTAEGDQIAPEDVAPDSLKAGIAKEDSAEEKIK
jgi:hypothetical protein